MTTSEKLPVNQDDQINEGVVQAEEEETINPLADIPREAIMPKMKGLDILKEGIYTVDLEKTINDMFLVIKNMESQLEKALTINTLLEKDLSEAKEVIAELKDSKSKLEDTIERMESEAPSKRELQMEIDQMIEERNNAEISIREMKSQVKKMQETVIQHQQRSGNLEEEKQDVITEIDYLESRLRDAAKEINHCKKEVNTLRGEKLIHEEKIKSLESDLQETLDEKYRLIRDIKTSKKAVDELSSTLSDKKLRAKKSFYKSEDQETKKHRQ
jgi:chromosome segregation ATPase